MQGLHGPPGDKGNRVSLSPRTRGLVTNVFMMGWNDQMETPDLTEQIIFPSKSSQIERLSSEGLPAIHAGSLGPSTAVEARIFPLFQRRLNESHSNHQISVAIQ